MVTNEAARRWGVDATLHCTRSEKHLTHHPPPPFLPSAFPFNHSRFFKAIPKGDGGTVVTPAG